MPNTRDLMEKPKLKVMVWSPSGTGKTHLLGTAAELGPMYIFDTDLRLQGIATRDIEYDSYRDANQSQPNAYDAASAKLDKLKGLNPFPYEVVALDGLTTFSIIAMNRAIPATKAFMPQLPHIQTNNVTVPAQPDYMTAMALTEQFISKLCALPCHVIVTAHEDNDKDDLTGRIFKNIAVSGKLAIRLPGYFNELWRMQVSTTAVEGKAVNKYQLVTRPDNLYSARTCYRDALFPLEEPDFVKIYAKICDYLVKTKANLPPPRPSVMPAAPPKGAVAALVKAATPVASQPGMSSQSSTVVPATTPKLAAPDSQSKKLLGDG